MPVAALGVSCWYGCGCVGARMLAFVPRHRLNIPRDQPCRAPGSLPAPSAATWLSLLSESLAFPPFLKNKISFKKIWNRNPTVLAFPPFRSVGAACQRSWDAHKIGTERKTLGLLPVRPQAATRGQARPRLRCSITARNPPPVSLPAGGEGALAGRCSPSAPPPPARSSLPPPDL